MMARRLESSGDAPARWPRSSARSKLDPQSAEIPAEIAGFHSRQNQATEAVAAAEQALKLDKDNVEAHNILGIVYSAWSRRRRAAAAGTDAVADAHGGDRTSRRDSQHAADGDQSQPADDAGRLQLRAGKADLAVPILEKVAPQAPWAAEPLLLLAEARLAQGKRRGGSRRWCRRRKSIRATSRTLGDLYERQGRYEDAAAAPTSRRSPACKQPEPRSADALVPRAHQHPDGRWREGARRAEGIPA